MLDKASAVTRRNLLKGALAAAAAPYVITSFSLAGEGRPAPSNRRTMGCVGMGGRGTGDMRGFLGFGEVQVVAVCDVVENKRLAAKSTVDGHYGNAGCAAVNDFHEITGRSDIDIVMIGTPDHWHAIVSITAMKSGKDVFCEKPETLTVREGRQVADVVRRYGRVFSGGSQRVWEDYNWFHKMVRSGAIGDVQEVWVNVGPPSQECYLPEEPIPAGLDWNLWLGPAPMVPFNTRRLNFRAWRDYSGGGMTDWGAHCFGGAMFCCQLQNTGPVEIIPPDNKDNPLLTYVFANGIRFHHNGGWGGHLSFKGANGELPDRGVKQDAKKMAAPAIYIPNYKGTGGLQGDFLHCVKTREQPFRNIEVAHRTVTVCHLGNIAYWLNRRIKWDPAKEEIIGDEEAARWLERPKRAPWRI
jgi:predicted dehydrogenase